MPNGQPLLKMDWKGIKEAVEVKLHNIEIEKKLLLNHQELANEQLK